MKALLRGVFGERGPQTALASADSVTTVQKGSAGGTEARVRIATESSSEAEPEAGESVITVVARTRLGFQDIGELYDFLEGEMEDCSMVTELDLSQVHIEHYSKEAVEQLLGLLKDKLKGVTKLSLGNVSVELEIPEGLSGVRELLFKDLKSYANIRFKGEINGVRSIKIKNMLHGSRINFPEDMGALEELELGRVCTEVVLPEGMNRLRVLKFTSILEGSKLSLMRRLPSLESIETEGVLDAAGIEIPERKEDGLPKLSEFKAREVRNDGKLPEYIRALMQVEVQEG